ncbi:MAG: PcfK-like family protein [Spirochaetales bacterium]|jgi:hypothetical protein|nr:PcfK-like family protein [Methanomethylophilus sp.]MBQ2527390.1 PcfK-like family protein [Spirochaetales bacterium]
MKGTRAFQETLEQYLSGMAQQDQLFADKFNNPSKTMEGCVNFVLSEVQKSGMNGFTDPEIYSMAVHYFVEEGIKDVPAMKDCQVVVNHQVELTAEEIEEMRQKAKEKVLADEVIRLRNAGKKPSVVKPQQEEEQLLLSFD